MEFFSGTYFTAPEVALNRPVSASEGTGIIISTLFAVERRLNCDFALIMYSTREWECFSIEDSIQINGFTWKETGVRERERREGRPLPECSSDRTSIRIRHREERKKSFDHSQSEINERIDGISHPPIPHPCSSCLKERLNRSARPARVDTYDPSFRRALYRSDPDEAQACH